MELLFIESENRDSFGYKLILEDKIQCETSAKLCLLFILIGMRSIILIFSAKWDVHENDILSHSLNISPFFNFLIVVDIEFVESLQQERYFGPHSPLIVQFFDTLVIQNQSLEETQI